MMEEPGRDCAWSFCLLPPDCSHEGRDAVELGSRASDILIGLASRPYEVVSKKDLRDDEIGLDDNRASSKEEARL